MIGLGIHTAGPFCGVAILDNDELIAVREVSMRRGHDQFLPGVVDDVMREAGLAYNQLDRISVCVGPGSFTGIRIGVAFARGMALAHGSQAFGITSLEALVSSPPDHAVLALIPAKIRPPDQTFWAQIIDGTDRSDPFELSANALYDHLMPDMQVIATPDAEVTLAELAPDLAVKYTPITAAGVPRWAGFLTAENMRSPSPLYVRDPDAIPAKSPLL